MASPTRTDRILVLTGICCLLIVLAVRGLAFNVIADNELEQVVELGGTAAPYRGDPYRDLLGAGPLKETYGRFAFRSEELEFPSSLFYEDQAIAEYRDRRSREDRYRRAIAPPLELRHERIPTGVLLVWDANPKNEAIAREVAGNPLLKTGYHIYRWRSGEQPQVIASGDLSQTRHLDEALGPRGGDVFYSVLTVLQGRIGTRETVIESERSATLTVHLDDAFELRLISGTTDTAVIEVTVPTSSGPRSERFEVSEGQSIGSVRQLDGAACDFATGLLVDEIGEVETVREERVRHPVFQPDGSRAFEENGFLFRDEVRKIPVQRLEVRCSGERVAPRVLSLDRS